MAGPKSLEGPKLESRGLYFTLEQMEPKMSGSLKLGLIIIGTVIGLYLVLILAKALLSLVVPILVIGGIVLIVYGLVSRNRSIGGRRSRYLP